MPVELTILDWVLLGGFALLAGIGLVRGLSGELGSLAGLVAGLATGFLLYGAAQTCADVSGLVARGMGVPGTIVIDFCFGLAAFGIVRWVVVKFVSCCLGRVTNAFFGLLSGIFKGLAVTALLMGVGFVRPGEYSGGFLASNSTIVRLIASRADSFECFRR